MVKNKIAKYKRDWNCCKKEGKKNLKWEKIVKNCQSGREERQAAKNGALAQNLLPQAARVKCRWTQAYACGLAHPHTHLYTVI